MKYKTLFRLIIKAIGVWCCVQGAADLALNVANVFAVLAQGQTGLGGSYVLNWAARSAAQLGIGLYLFFGGKWVVNMAIPSNRPYCPECAYDLSGAVSDRCPECGTLLNQELLRSSNDQPE